MVKRVVIFCLTALMLFMFNITAFALNNGDLDLTKKGSVSVTMRDSMTQDVVSGGELTLIKVADLTIDDGNSFYTYTEAFKSCEWDLDDLESSILVDNLSSFVSENKLSGITSSIDITGVGSFKELDIGLYLVIQQTPSTGYFAINPFLVSVPLISENEFVYDVDASAKVETLKEIPVTETPEPTAVPTAKPSTLPQTGQLNWPVPILIVTGLVIFAAGWILTISHKRKSSNEA